MGISNAKIDVTGEAKTLEYQADTFERFVHPKVTYTCVPNSAPKSGLAVPASEYFTATVSFNHDCSHNERHIKSELLKVIVSCEGEIVTLSKASTCYTYKTFYTFKLQHKLFVRIVKRADDSVVSTFKAQLTSDGYLYLENTKIDSIQTLLDAIRSTGPGKPCKIDSKAMQIKNNNSSSNNNSYTMIDSFSKSYDEPSFTCHLPPNDSTLELEELENKMTINELVVNETSITGTTFVGNNQFTVEIAEPKHIIRFRTVAQQANLHSILRFIDHLKHHEKVNYFVGLQQKYNIAVKKTATVKQQQYPVLLLAQPIPPKTPNELLAIADEDNMAYKLPLTLMQGCSMAIITSKNMQIVMEMPEEQQQQQQHQHQQNLKNRKTTSSILYNSLQLSSKRPEDMNHALQWKTNKFQYEFTCGATVNMDMIYNAAANPMLSISMMCDGSYMLLNWLSPSQARTSLQQANLLKEDGHDSATLGETFHCKQYKGMISTICKMWSINTAFMRKDEGSIPISGQVFLHFDRQLMQITGTHLYRPQSYFEEENLPFYMEIDFVKGIGYYKGGNDIKVDNAAKNNSFADFRGTVVPLASKVVKLTCVANPNTKLKKMVNINKFRDTIVKCCK